MSRSPACRAQDSRQLDFFSFSAPAALVDTSPPAPPDTVALNVIQFPVAPVIKLPEIVLEPETISPLIPKAPEPRRFQITNADRLGDGLVAEGRAPDGLIEAVSVQAAAGFALAAQWHPEWQATRNEFSKALFAAFGDAARAHARGEAAANADR